MSRSLRACIFAITASFGMAHFASPAISQNAKPAVRNDPVLRSSIQRVEQGGLAVEFSLGPVGADDKGELLAGADVLARIRLLDVTSGKPVRGYRPKAWISLRQSDHASMEEADCAARIRMLVSGSLASRATIDLNSYLLLTLNQDKTISVINPQVSFGASKLESLIELPANGEDWVLDKSKQWLYVSLPDADAVAIVDMAVRKMVATLSTGDGGKPTRLAWQPDGRLLWLGLDGSNEVLAIDPDSKKIVQRIPVGGGMHQLAFNGDGRLLFVSNSADDTVTTIDLTTRARKENATVTKTPVALAYASAGRAIYVASLNGDYITQMDGDTGKQLATIATDSGVVALGVEPKGRFVFAVNQLKNAVVIIDSATNAIVARMPVAPEPDQITFTEGYAYIRSLNSEKFSLIDLVGLAMGKPSVVEIQAGQQAPSTQPEMIGHAAMIAPTPEGGSAIVANAPDATLYFYQEGMMAPIGTISNYKRAPRGLMILDHGLAQIAPGEYSAIVRLPAQATYDASILIDQPRTTACFETKVEQAKIDDGAPRNAVVAVKFRSEKTRIRFGANSSLAFELIDPKTSVPFHSGSELPVKIFGASGGWRRQAVATRIEDGIYEVSVRLPEPGRYIVVFPFETSGGETRKLVYAMVDAREPRLRDR
jgi:YVTN family beta-propeller protein